MNVHLVCFLLSLLLECGSSTLVYLTFMSPCLNDNALNIQIFGLIIPSVIIPDFVLVMCLLCGLRTVGQDPLAIVYNFMGALFCFAGGAALLASIIKMCDDLPGIFLPLAGSLTILAGICHVVNCMKAYRRLPLSEKYYPPRRKHAKRSKKTVRKRGRKEKSARKSKCECKSKKDKPKAKIESRKSSSTRFAMSTCCTGEKATQSQSDVKRTPPTPRSSGSKLNILASPCLKSPKKEGTCSETTTLTRLKQILPFPCFANTSNTCPTQPGVVDRFRQMCTLPFCRMPTRKEQAVTPATKKASSTSLKASEQKPKSDKSAKSKSNKKVRTKTPKFQCCRKPKSQNKSKQKRGGSTTSLSSGRSHTSCCSCCLSDSSVASRTSGSSISSCCAPKKEECVV